MSALTDRDTNAQPTSQPMAEPKQVAEGAENQAQDARESKPLLEQKFFAANHPKSQAYISPSDAILSPASQKLADFKQKQINKQPGNRKPAARTLFARTPSSCSSGGFEDINGGAEKS